MFVVVVRCALFVVVRCYCCLCLAVCFFLLFVDVHDLFAVCVCCVLFIVIACCLGCLLFDCCCLCLATVSGLPLRFVANCCLLLTVVGCVVSVARWVALFVV